MTTKVTSRKIAHIASSTLTSKKTGKSTRTTAGSALSQVSPPKVTSAKVATTASKVLRDGRTGAISKSTAGSALSQRNVHSAPKKGSLSIAVIRKAVSATIVSQKKK